MLLCNDVSHWLGANLESDLRYHPLNIPGVVMWHFHPRVPCPYAKCVDLHINIMIDVMSFSQ